MKSLKTIIAVLAIANMLAILGFVGWLKMSDRLSPERIEKIKAILRPTLADEAAAMKEEERKAEVAKVEEAVQARLDAPPVSAAEQIKDREADMEATLQNEQRRASEIAQLRASLIKQKEDLEAREKQLARDREAFEAERKAIAEIEGTKQFRTALSTLEAQKPPAAKAVLNELWMQGLTDEVLSYLAKMDEGKRGKVMAEFVKDDAALAADLLERLRTRGVEVPKDAGSAAAGPSSASAEGGTPR